MKKNLLALAVAGAFAAPAAALAQSSFVQIYGTLNADLEAAKADGSPLFSPTLFAPTYGVTGGASAANGVVIRPTGVNSQAAAVRADAFTNIPNQAGVSSNSSNIGFRGSEDLGGGLKGIFQIESALNLDTGGGNLGGRNTNVGLSSNWGTAFYGQWDTPYKYITLKSDPFYATSAPSFNSVIGSPGFNVLSTTFNSPTLTGASLTTLAQDAAFDRRQGNSVQYWSPDFAGFSGRLMYSAGERTQNYAVSGLTAAVPTRAEQLNPWMWGASFQYDNGPIYAAASYEEHKDYFGSRLFTGTTALGSSSKDWGGKAVIGAQNLWGFSIYGVFERLSYSTDGLEATNLANSGLVKDWKRNAYGFFGTYGFGNFTLRAGWMTANDASCTSVGAQICNASGTGTNQYSIGGSYNFSKRTSTYVFYTLQDNGDLGRYRLGTTTGPVQSNVPVGGQAQAYGLGIRHTF